MVYPPDCSIPWWLAEVAYVYYVEECGEGQSLERMAERGGFGRSELIAFLRRDRSFKGIDEEVIAASKRAAPHDGDKR